MPGQYCTLDIETACLDITNPRIVRYTRGKNITHSNPVFSKIVLAGLKPVGGKPTFFDDQDERALVTKAWEWLGKFFDLVDDARVVTWNGYKFDVPFLMVRSAVLGVTPTVRLNTYPWGMETSNHFDCLKFLSGGESLGWNTLEVTCLQLGIDVPENYIPGEDVDDLFRRGEMDKIREHNGQDLEITEKLYERIRQVAEALVEEPATRPQKELLKSRGKTIPSGLTKKEASRMIDEIMRKP